METQDEGHHEQDQRECGKHRSNDLHDQKAIAGKGLPREKRVCGFAPRGLVVDTLRQIPAIDALGARLGRQHHVDLPDGVRLLLQGHGAAGDAGAGRARLINLR